MCDLIVHRGPDDEGTFIDGSLGMGMRRLSILDLSGGSQPIYNEDRSIVVVFNGEIYNYKELRKDLVDRGHQFRSQGDTEVLAHLYEEYGDAFVEHLNGMFAIALWDRSRQRLVLVRDRLGQKPIYYSWTSKGLVFGSELKCVLEADEVPRDLDLSSLYHYFTLGYVPNPGSVYRAIRQLPPGSRLIVEHRDLKIEKYWSPPHTVNREADRKESQHRLRELLTDATRLRMRSDVPLGAFLSGGLDSSITVALMAQQSQSAVKTFHVDFDTPDVSEMEYARAVAKRYGTEHHELVVQPDAAEILDELVKHFDEPFGDSSAVPTYYISKLTRQHVTVALAGDGGDESFGGYRRYKWMLQRRNLPGFLRSGFGIAGKCLHACLPRSAPGRRFFRSLGMQHFEFYAVGTREVETRECLSHDFLDAVTDVSTADLFRRIMQEHRDPSDPLSPYTSVDTYHYLPDDILTKVDRMSMAHSLEVRSPFLDYRIFEFAATLPWNWKIQGNDGKVILRDAFSGDLPPKVLESRKRGFSPPLEDWLRGVLRTMLEDSLHDQEIDELGFFDMPQLRAFAQEHMNGWRDRSDLLWKYLFFVRWWHHAKQSTTDQSRRMTLVEN